MENFKIQSNNNITSLIFSNYEKDSGAYQLVYQDLHARIQQTSWNSFGDIYNLYNLFKDIDENWKGWNDKKEYISLDNDFILSATSDHTGHIFLTIILQKYDWKFQTIIVLDQTQISTIVKSIKDFFYLK
jgi:hypothetical protein